MISNDRGAKNNARNDRMFHNQRRSQKAAHIRVVKEHINLEAKNNKETEWAGWTAGITKTDSVCD